MLGAASFASEPLGSAPGAATAPPVSATQTVLPSPPPAPANQTAADYGAEFVNLMPQGLAWPRDPDALQVQVATALALTASRVHQRANALLVDAFPASAVELLPQWEETLGLPDPCLGPSPTIYQRQLSVVAALTSRGGQSSAYMVEYAAMLGYAITVEEFQPLTCGMPCGSYFGGSDWASTWRVILPTLARTYWTFGVNYCGEPFSSWGAGVLECELKKIKPANTILQFAYVGTPIMAALGIFVLGKNSLG